MQVLNQEWLDFNIYDCEHSNHYEERAERVRKALHCEKGYWGPICRCFVCDTGHKDGLELHILTQNGLVLIMNQETRKLVTVLIARPGQIKRYYDAVGLPAPAKLVNKARKHQNLHLNYA